jgi:Phage integrase, N-terminal SAM-like domain
LQGEFMESSKPAAQPPKLLDRVVAKMRLLHYSKRTEAAYVDWIRRYILYHNKRHPKDMGGTEVEAFLSFLAMERNVSASTQNQAFAALLFLYRQILEIELPNINALRARRSERLPVVLSVEEARKPGHAGLFGKKQFSLAPLRCARCAPWPRCAPCSGGRRWIVPRSVSARTYGSRVVSAGGCNPRTGQRGKEGNTSWATGFPASSPE